MKNRRTYEIKQPKEVTLQQAQLGLFCSCLVSIQYWATDQSAPKDCLG